MKLSRKIVLVAAAIAFPISMVAVTGGIASAKGKVNGTGTVTCTTISGTIKFNPALKTTGPFTTEQASIAVKIGGCSGGTPNPTKGIVKENLNPGTSNDCTSLATSAAEMLSVKWAGKLNPSVTAFSGYTTGTNGSGDAGFILPNSGGTGTTTGSFAGSGAHAAAYSNMTEAQILAACGSPSGLKSLKVTSGNSTS